MITQHEAQSIINDRKNNHSTLIQLARKYRHDWRVIKNVLVSANEYFRERPQSINYWKNDFFNNANPTTAYWAGFGFADGCVRKTNAGTRFHVIVGEKDYQHLEKFAKDIEFSVTKIMKDKTQSRTLQVYAHGYDLIESLKKWGIVERKTYNFIEPNIQPELIPHFLRGWCDGDGSICNKPGYQRFEVVGNSCAIDWYVEQLRNLGYLGHINTNDTEGKVWKRLLITGIYQIRSVAHILYADNELFTKLERKWNSIF